MTNFSIYRKTTGTLKIPRLTSGSMDIVRKTTGNFKIPMPQLASPPVFVSAEVGLIDAYTIDVLLSLALNESKIPDAVDLIPVFLQSELASSWVSAIYGSPANWETFTNSGTSITSAIANNSDQATAFLTDVSGLTTGDVVRLTYNITLNSGVTPQLRVYKTLSGVPVVQFVQVQLSEGLNTYDITLPSGADGIVTRISNTTGSVTLTSLNFSGTFSLKKLVATQVNSITISGLHVYPVLNREITAGETGTIQYIPNALLSKKLTGLNGGLVAAFTESVTNNVSGATQPVLQSITVEDAAPTVFVLTYDIALDETSTPATTAFVIAGHTVASVLITGLTCKVTVSERVYWGDSDTLAYTKPATNMIKSTTGGEADSFTAQAVTNSIVVPIVLSDANAVFLYEFDDLTTITKDGSNLVSAWADKNGSGRNLLQATGTNQPLWSADGILFDGIDNFMACVAFTLIQPEMFFILFKQITYSTFDPIFDGNTDLSGSLSQHNATPVLRITAGTVIFEPSNLPLNTLGIARCLFNGANSSLQINNTTKVTGNAGAANMGGFKLGYRPTPRYGHFQVKGIIGRKAVPSAEDEIVMYNYLANKYSLPKI